VTSAGGDRDAPRGRNYWLLSSTVVGIYFLLALLCYWGALAWTSWFLFSLGTIWAAVGILWVLWFLYVEVTRDPGTTGNP